MASTSSSFWRVCLLVCVAAGSTIAVEGSRRQLKQSFARDCEFEGVWVKHGEVFTSQALGQRCKCMDSQWRDCKDASEYKDCEFEGVWTKHGELYTSKAGKRCKCMDSLWRDCQDGWDYKEPDVIFVKAEPKVFEDCEIYGEWVNHGDRHTFDRRECICYDSNFISCKDVKEEEPEIKVIVIKEEPKEKFKDCEKDGEWTKHGSLYTSKVTYQKCRCWDGKWDSCVYDYQPASYSFQPYSYGFPVWFSGR